MTFAGLALFIGVYAAAVASPGPGVAAVVARGLGRGLAGMPAFIAGFVVGDLVWFLAAALGLAAIAEAYAPLLTAIKYAGAAYLLYLAWKLWTAPTRGTDVAVESTAERPLKLFSTSLSLTLGNPKVIVFFMAVLPTVVDVARLSAADIATLVPVIALVLGGVMLAYAIAASRARTLLRSERAIRLANRGSAVALAGVAVAVARS